MLLMQSWLILSVVIDTDDFDFMHQTITFPRDEDTLSFQIMLNDDMILEERETFVVTLNVSGDVRTVEVDERDSVMVTIEDNDGKHVYVCSIVT